MNLYLFMIGYGKNKKNTQHISILALKTPSYKATGQGDRT